MPLVTFASVRDYPVGADDGGWRAAVGHRLRQPLFYFNKGPYNPHRRHEPHRQMRQQYLVDDDPNPEAGCSLMTSILQGTQKLG
jgi:hypothetical protein